MALPLKEYDAVGVAITDEKVFCNEAVVIGGVTYYRGYLNYIPNGNIQGDDSATYGIWTLAGKGGTRFFVLTSGLPASAAQVAVDLANGWVWSLSAQLTYVRYLAHEPIRHNIAPLEIYAPWLLETGVAATLGATVAPAFMKFCYALVDTSGGLPSAAATLVLSNGGDTLNLSLSNTTATYVIEFSEPFKVLAGQTLSLTTTDGKGAWGVRVTLWDQ